MRIETIGDATLYLGDCLEILPTLEAGSVDAILTDLPYGTTACSWDEIIPFEPMWEQVKRLLKPRGVFVTTASQPFTSALVMSNLAWFKYEWIWDKLATSNFGSVKYQPLRNHENIVVFCGDTGIYNPQIDKGNLRTQFKGKYTREKRSIFYTSETELSKVQKNIGYPKTIIRAMRPNNRTEDGQRYHPTQKPVALYEYLARTYTNPGDLILDFTMGSGTTGVAALRLGRRFIGIEIEPKYFDIACRRIEQENRQIKMF